MSQTMKAAVLHGAKDIRVATCRVPELAPAERQELWGGTATRIYNIRKREDEL